jgi:hypothetical protein
VVRRWRLRRGTPPLGSVAPSPCASCCLHGSLQVWTERASLNIEALTLAILAAALQFGLRLGIASTLAVSAGAALTWSLIQTGV